MAILKPLVLLDEERMSANFSRKPQKNCFLDSWRPGVGPLVIPV